MRCENAVWYYTDMQTRQIVYVHGGTTFPSHEEYLSFLHTKTVTLDRLRPSRDWKSNLQETLGTSFDVFAPHMPNGTNAVYAEWELWFSRILPLLTDGVVLIGHSLGGVFLVRYLSEHEPPVRITATLLVAAPFRDSDLGESLGEFLPPKDFGNFRDRAGRVFLYHSTDDPVVPYTHLNLYARELPNATVRICENMGHCNTSAFPQLEDDLRTLTW